MQVGLTALNIKSANKRENVLNNRINNDVDFSGAVSKLQSFLTGSKGRKIAIYGMGRHSRDIAQSIDLKKCLAPHRFVGFFCDTPVIQHTFAGYPCVSKAYALKSADCIILSSDVYESQMLKRLCETNCQCLIFEMYPHKNQLDYLSAHEIEVLAIDNAASFTLRFDHLLPSFGMRIRWLQSLDVLSAKKKEAEQWMRKHANIPADQLAYEGVNLFEISRGTIACHINRADIDKQKDALVIKQQITNTIAFLLGFKDIFSRHDCRVRVLLILNGFWNDVWAASIMAGQAGIQIIATELSFFPELIYVEHVTGRVANDTMLAVYSDVYLRDRQVTPEQSKTVRDFFTARNPEGEKRADHFGQPQSEGSLEIRTRLSIPESNRVAIAIMQVASDTTIVYDNPLYNDNIAFILDIIPWFESHPEWTLIIKPHPKESAGFAARGNTPLAKITYRRLKELIEHKSYNNILLAEADSTNIYSLFDLAEFAVTINSQAGLEFSAQTHCRTIVLGKAAYGNKGFTVDIPSRAFISVALDSVAARTKLTEKEIKNMERFLYHMLFEYLYPRSLDTDKIRFNRLIRLFRGANSFLSPNSNTNPVK